MTRMSEGRKARLIARIGNLTVLDRIDPHAFDGKCELCGVVEELRPYGPDNKSICFDCAMKDEAGTSARYAEMLNRSD